MKIKNIQNLFVGVMVLALAASVTLAVRDAYTVKAANAGNSWNGASLVPASRQADQGGAPWVTEKPAGYRDWRLISVAHEEGNIHSLGAMLGNDVAIKAYREGTLPFPDGTIIAALHYQHVASEENDKVFSQPQSFVPGPPTNVQFMVKDSKKYAATGGWGFGHFNANGKPVDAAFMQPCYPCHAQNKAHDLVFTHYAP